MLQTLKVTTIITQQRITESANKGDIGNCKKYY